MSQCQKTENQAEQNKSHAVAGIEAHPTPPHCWGIVEPLSPCNLSCPASEEKACPMIRAALPAWRAVSRCAQRFFATPEFSLLVKA